MDIQVAIADERQALVSNLDGLTEREWSTASLCDQWTIRGVVGHLLTPHARSTRDVLRSGLRYRSLDTAFATIGREIGRRPVAELMKLLRQFASVSYRSPMLGWASSLTDIVIHGQDIYEPLGIRHRVASDRLRTTLDFLTSWRAHRFFSPRSRQVGLALTATDLPWSNGSGLAVEGQGLSLAMALAGRSSAISTLSGDGVNLLSSRLGRT